MRGRESRPRRNFARAVVPPAGRGVKAEPDRRGRNFSRMGFRATKGSVKTRRKSASWHPAFLLEILLLT
jgi:hypothetical protein